MSRTLGITVTVLSPEEVQKRIDAITGRIHSSIDELRERAYTYDLDLEGLASLAELERLEFLAGR